ncbi:uncharacterized protein BDW47DRAFT_102373 [Aspergillus candidus]|uniref:Uncharacterized protein n=1 Tax=Aspergillus candidus TaxID=41067 RepID=A0A2I2FGK6_ASPCN|nr:hypothetical protein BDW47DRAFT_102373 [Aspergillus candidus]PLB39766.1 hypothetical protein BDW47DRAFT_102373 [Aspergillus candidus]
MVNCDDGILSLSVLGLLSGPGAELPVIVASAGPGDLISGESCCFFVSTCSYSVASVSSSSFHFSFLSCSAASGRVNSPMCF